MLRTLYLTLCLLVALAKHVGNAFREKGRSDAPKRQRRSELRRKGMESEEADFFLETVFPQALHLYIGREEVLPQIMRFSETCESQFNKNAERKIYMYVCVGLLSFWDYLRFPDHLFMSCNVKWRVFLICKLKATPHHRISAGCICLQLNEQKWFIHRGVFCILLRLY